MKTVEISGRRVGAVAGLVALLAVAAVLGATARATGPDETDVQTGAHESFTAADQETAAAQEIAATLGVDEHTALSIAHDIRLRRDLGFSTDLHLVARLRTEPGAADPRYYPEIPMTQEEADEFEARQAAGFAAAPIEETLSARAPSTFAGTWIDHSTGQLVVNTTAAGLEFARITVDEATGPDRTGPDRMGPDRVRIDVVEHSLAELRSVQSQWSSSSADHREVDVQVDVPTNSLSVTLSPGLDAAGRAQVERKLEASGVPYTVRVEPLLFEPLPSVRVGPLP